MLRMQILLVLAFVIGAFGIAYLQGDDDNYKISCYTCSKTGNNLKNSSFCKKGQQVTCKLCRKEGAGTEAIGAAIVTKDGPQVGTCVRSNEKDAWCNKTIPCEGYCNLCKRTGTQIDVNAWFIFGGNECD